jgi:glucose-1-phosphate cytidylyltransferase
MKAIILAGGKGTRISEETILLPKPLIKIGEEPIMWHIMKTYEVAGIKEFVICLGYKAELIKQYFSNYRFNHCDNSINTATGETAFHGQPIENWQVSLVYTGEETMTGGRLLRARDWVGNDTFSLTYGDSLLDIDVKELISFHRSHKRLATVTGVRRSARFGVLKLQGDKVIDMLEKTGNDEVWINGGFFILEPGVFDYIEGDQTSWEHAPLKKLALDGELMVFRHHGFWHPMDTQHEKRHLEELWNTGSAPWKIWADKSSD